MYIAAFVKETVGLCQHCNGDGAISSIETLEADKLQELEDCPEDNRKVGSYKLEERRRDYLKILLEEKTEINPTSGGEAVTVRRFMYYLKRDLLLVPMPKALEALINK